MLVCIQHIQISANGQKGHEELQMIMQTLMARFTARSTLLIPGVKGKINQQGEITDRTTMEDLANFIDGYKSLIDNVNV